jgi:hypothetical protein
MGVNPVQRRFAQRYLMEQFVTGSVNTFGWDTVFAIRLADVNEQIRRQGSSPASFSQESDGYKASSDFGDWQIGQTGDGTLLHMSLPLSNVAIEVGGKQKSLPDATATVEVQLEFVPHNPDLLMVGETMPYNLVIKTEAEKMTFGAGLMAQEPPANIMGIEFADGEKRFGDGAVLQACLNEWLCDNLAQFAHVFATVNLARQVADGAFDWVKPTYASYSFLGGATEEECVLAVLCLSAERSAQHLYETLSPAALPTTSSANFIISGERMLDDMIRRSLPAAFHGLQPEDAVLSEDKRSLVVDKSTHLTDVKHDGKTFDATLKYLKIWLDGETVCVESKTETKVSPGVYSICRSVNRYKIHLVNAKSGGQTLAYAPVGEPDVDHTTRHSKTVEIVKWIIIAIGAIVATVVGVLTAGAGFLVGGLIVALVAGTFALVSQIPNIIEAVKRGDAPPIDLLVTNATSPIRWAGEGLFRLKDALFSDSLMLSGDFVAAS